MDTAGELRAAADAAGGNLVGCAVDVEVGLGAHADYPLKR